MNDQPVPAPKLRKNLNRRKHFKRMKLLSGKGVDSVARAHQH